MKEGECLLHLALSVVSTKTFSWWMGRLGSRPLGGRHASVVPALPDEYESHLNNIRGGRRDDEGGDVEEDPSRQGTSFLCSGIGKSSRDANHTKSMKMGMDITRSSVAVRIWHSPLPPHSLHTVAPHTPRSYKETNSSNSWIPIPRCKLRILLGRDRMGRRYLRVSRAS